MATAWLARSLSCKSSAVADDVYSLSLLPKKHPPTPPSPTVKAFQPSRERRSRGSTDKERPTRKKKKKPQQQPAQLQASPARPSSALLAMTELPEGHSSRRVVELIFASGWGGGAHASEPPEVEVEALFRVRSTARAVARFEDARRAATLAPGADARCAADGNEMMRFQCRAAEPGEVICAAVATTGAAVRTFASSGAADADASVGAAAPGRRGMLVCRVIAGRVRRADDHSRLPGEGGHDSVDAGGGELVVLDGRAVLPCFLVVYKVNNHHQASELCGQPPRAPELIR